MQFHLDGYRTGDPFISDPHPSVAARRPGLPDETDVLVVGAGPAGLVLAAQLANAPELCTVVIDQRDGPLEVGQADGVACRTVEILEAFGLAGRVAEEAYQVNEVAFWTPDPADPSRIVRSGRIDDVEDGVSEMPHLIVNQARMLAHLRGHMERSAARTSPFHGLRLDDLQVDSTGTTDHPVTASLAHVRDGRDTGEVATVRARYVVGCDGVRSATRAAIGRRLAGDLTDSAWGVMDVLAVTDFPDIRLKTTIRSTEGTVVLIPREGGQLVRFYIELDPVRDARAVHDRAITPAELTAVANRILHPYSIEVRQTAWCTVYEVGQRLCDRFDDVPEQDAATRHPRVFIAGDACHTHSAKAGQGMNVSMADAWNLGWKLAAVLRGNARPELLHTYTAERHAVAQELIDFDREFAARMATRGSGGTGSGGNEPADFRDYFRRQGRFTAGVAVRYLPSMITGEPSHQHLAAGFTIGARFHSVPVVRLADAKRLHLGHVARADGAWRLYVLADTDGAAAGSRLHRFCDALDDHDSPVRRLTPHGADPDTVLDVRAVLQQGHRQVPVDDLPPLLRPVKGALGLVDHEKVFCIDPDEDLFTVRGVDRERGCVVVVRPDQHVAHVLPLDAPGKLARFLQRSLLPQR